MYIVMKERGKRARERERKKIRRRKEEEKGNTSHKGEKKSTLQG